MPSTLARALHQRWTTSLLVTAAASWLVLSGFVVSLNPIVGAAVSVAPVVGWLLIEYSAVRVIIVVAGGMIVLGSSSDLGPNKLIYAGALVVCSVVAAYRLLVDPPVYLREFKLLVPWGLAVVGVLVLSFFLAPAGSSISIFGRQSIFYLLILLGPVIGLDSGRDLSPRVVYLLIGVIGVVAAAGFAADWLNRRGVTALPFGRFVLSSLVLPALAFGLSLVMFFHTRRLLNRILWMVPIISIPIAMLVTGTRTNLIVFLAIIAVLGPARLARVPLGRMLFLVAVAGVGGIALFPIVASFAVADPTFLAVRVQAAISAVSGMGDQSLGFRQEQAQSALLMLDQSPLLGYGLGYVIPFTVDSPLLTVLRLGWVGTGVVVAFIGALSMAVLRGNRVYGASPASTAWWGFLLVCLANLFFGTPLEDRGFGFAVMLVVMGISAEYHAASSASTHSAHFGRDAPLQWNRSHA